MKPETRLKKFIQQFQKVLRKSVEDDINEADTRFLVRRILDQLGYDGINDLTSEFMVKQQYVDLAARVGGNILFFVEIKKISTKLRKDHTRQVSSYCLDKGVKWAVLTTAAHWQIYKVHSIPVERDLLAETDLLKDPIDEATSTLLLLQKDRVKAGSLEKCWENLRAMSNENLMKAIFDKDVVQAIREQVEKATRTSVAPKALLDSLAELLNEKARETLGKTVSLERLARRLERKMEREKQVRRTMPWHQADLKGSKPQTVTVDGNEIAVTKWRDAFIAICNLVLRDAPQEKLEEIRATVRGSKNCYFSFSSQDIAYKASRLDCGLFAETGLSSHDIQKILKDVIAVLGKQNDCVAITLR
jgi:hypothetical protein